MTLNKPARGVTVALALALACVALLAPPVPADPRGSDPAVVAESLCPRVTTVPPDDDCYSIPLPGEAWGVAAILTPTDEGLALYERLIPEPYGMPATPQVGVFISRLNVGGANSGFEADPGQGYQEGSVALRASLPPGHNTPWDEGWFVLAQPINDEGQYGSGRDVGIPKYMASMTFMTDPGARIVQDARGWTFGDRAEPGHAIDPKGGNELIIEWTSDELSGGDPAAVEGLVALDAPLLGHDRPYDELDAETHDPELTKFTPAAYVPAGEAGAVTPLTAGPDVRLGRTTVTLKGKIPVVGESWSALIGAPIQTVLGAAAYVSGFVHMTFDQLDHEPEA